MPLSLLERRDGGDPPRRLGVRVLSGLSGNLSIPKYGSGCTP